MENPAIHKIQTSVAARILQLSPKTLWKYKKLGKLKPVCRQSSAPKSPWLWNREEIIAFKCKL